MPENASVIKVRKARIGDIGFLADRAFELIKAHENYDEFFYAMTKSARQSYFSHFKKIIKNKAWLLVLAEADKEIAGYALAAIEKRPPIYKLDKRCALHDIFVDEKFRGMGVSRKLFDKVLEFARENKTKMLQVIVDERNHKAIEIYKKFGFAEYDKTMAIKLP